MSNIFPRILIYEIQVLSQFLFCSIIIQKMKALLFLLALSAVSLGNLVSLNTQCPEQSVPDVNKICIKPAYIEGCLTYKSTEECFTCSEQYQLKNGRCSVIDEFAQNSNSLVGCLQTNNGECINCANGYRRVNGACQVGVKFCEEYNSDNTCKRCNIEYSLILDQCKHNFLLGCKIEQSDHTCSECHKPFQLENYQCIIKNCKSYNDFGCYACECGFYVTEKRSCQKMQEGCLKYNRGICVECQPHYKLKGGSCIIDGCLEYDNQFCKQCKEDYELTSGVCTFKNCMDWEEDSCRICKDGFHLLKGKCIASEGKFVCSG